MILSGRCLEPPHNAACTAQQSAGAVTETLSLLVRHSASAVRYTHGGTLYEDTLPALCTAQVWGGGGDHLFDRHTKGWTSFILPVDGGAATLYVARNDALVGIAGAQDIVPLDVVYRKEVRPYQPRGVLWAGLFNHTNDWIGFPAGAAFDIADFSLALWVRRSFDDIHGSQEAVIWQIAYQPGVPGGPIPRGMLVLWSGEGYDPASVGAGGDGPCVVFLVAQAHTGVFVPLVVQTGPLADGADHLVVLTRSGPNVTVYSDDAVVQNTLFVDPGAYGANYSFNNPAQGMDMGKFFNFNALYNSGLLWGVQTYSVALDTTQIHDLYTSGYHAAQGHSSADSALTAQWLFGEGTGLTVHDTIGSNDGTWEAGSTGALWANR